MTIETLKELMKKATPDWKFEKGKSLPGSIPSVDAAIISALPDICALAIELAERNEKLEECFRLRDENDDWLEKMVGLIDRRIL